MQTFVGSGKRSASGPAAPEGRGPGVRSIAFAKQKLPDGWDCRHSFHPYYEGTARTWTDEQLEKLKEKDITYNGEKMTEYDASQKQRYIERQLRRWKREYAAREAAGLDTGPAAAKIQEWNAKQKDFLRQTGLKRQGAREEVAVFGRDNVKSAMSKKSSAYDSEWEGTVPFVHDEKSIAQLTEYAEKRGIRFANIETFDGSSEILADEIDMIAEIKRRFKLGPEEASIVRFYYGPAGDFGESSLDRSTVLFNTCGLRSRSVTQRILNEDHDLSATTEIGIAAHEMGHIIASKYKLNGLEIARQAYYNTTGKRMSYDEVISRLGEDISFYCTDIADKYKRKKIQHRQKYYTEIIPEILGLHWTSSTDFTTEFVRIMEETIL